MKLFCEVRVDESDHVIQGTILDTAAELNLMTRSLVRRLGLSVVNAPISITGVDGMSSGSVQSVTLSVHGMNLTFQVVEKIDKESELLIGWPSLDWHGIQISSFKGDTHVVLNGSPLITSSSKFNTHASDILTIGKTTDVRLAKKVVVEPFSQRYVRVNWDRNYFRTSSFFVPSRVAGSALRVAAGAIDQSTSQVLVSNWSSTPVTILKNALIGYVTSHQYSVHTLSFDDDEMYLPQSSHTTVSPPTTNPTPPSTSHSSLPFTPSVGESYTKEELHKLLNESGVISSELSVSEREQLISMLSKHREVFAVNPNAPPVSTKTKMHVRLQDPNAQPIRSHPYRVPVHLQDVMKGLVNNMVSNGIVRKSSSPWASPVVLVTKPDGSYRFCIDYTKLNAASVKESFPLPNIEEHLDRLAGARIFTVMDLASGFWQIPVAESDVEKLAFVTPIGTYEPLRMPYGYVGAPPIFQAAISESLDPLLYAYVLVYIDDIIVYSNSFSDHLKHLSSCLSLLQKHNWHVKLSKCQFASSSVNYLGHKVSAGVISPIDKNIEKLLAMKRPETAADIVSFLATINYYRKFIKGYDYVIFPLRELEKKYRNSKEKFLLSSFPEAESSYLNILDLISSQPILHLFRLGLPILVKTDCSKFAWGGVLCQVEDGIEFPVAFVSGSLNSSQRNWPTWKREAYSSFKCIEKWRHYLLGSHFTLITDHEANKYILDPTKSHPPIIHTWILALSQYSYTVEHRPGKTLYIEDALSRSPSLLCLSLTSIHDRVSSHPLYSSIIHSLSSGTDTLSKEERELLGINADIFSKFVIENGNLFYVEVARKDRRFLRLVITDNDLLDVFHKHHTSPAAGHLGWTRTLEAISREYWCVDLFKKLKKLHDSCEICAKHSTIIDRSSEKHIFANQPFEILELDHIIVNVPSSSFNYILCVTDVFSRKAWFIPCKTLEAKETYSLLFIHVFSPFHFPKFIYTDLGSSFCNELDALICQATHMQHRYTLPRSKGHTATVENRNKLAERIISKFIKKFDQSDWSDYCYTASYSYNKSINPDSNMSPDYLIFGTNPFSIIELDNIGEAKEDYANSFVNTLKKAWSTAQQVTAKIFAKQKTIGAKFDISVGQYVWLSRKSYPNSYVSSLFPKFSRSNLGPFSVVAVDEGHNRVTLQITPSRQFETKLSYISPFHGVYVRDETQFTPFLDEIILVNIPDRTIIRKEKLLPDKTKLNYNIKSIVGKRISLKWNDGKFYYATVIGYTTNLLYNLVTFDERTIDKNSDKLVLLSEDFYKLKLYKTADQSKIEKWSLLTEY